ncbi:unnamed protein product [Laminaria digitata]
MVWYTHRYNKTILKQSKKRFFLHEGGAKLRFCHILTSGKCFLNDGINTTFMLDKALWTHHDLSRLFHNSRFSKGSGVRANGACQKGVLRDHRLLSLIRKRQQPHEHPKWEKCRIHPF